MTVIKPGKLQGHRYEHFGCTSCGNIRHLPAARGEEAPWCVCGSGNYSWRAPHPETQKSSLRWTQMVRVKVTVR